MRHTHHTHTSVLYIEYNSVALKFAYMPMTVCIRTIEHIFGTKNFPAMLSNAAEHFAHMCAPIQTEIRPHFSNVYNKAKFLFENFQALCTAR